MCQEVNDNYEFKIYYDNDLLELVTKHYPEYLAFLS